MSFKKFEIINLYESQNTALFIVIMEKINLIFHNFNIVLVLYNFSL